MKRLSPRASALLLDIYAHFQATDKNYSFDPENEDARFFNELKKEEMIETLGAYGRPVLKITGITSLGNTYAYRRREALISAGFPVLSAKQDSLLREWANHGVIKNQDEYVSDLKLLCREGLMDIGFADNTVCFIIGLTNEGRKYIDDRIPDLREEYTVINNSPVFNNFVDGGSSFSFSKSNAESNASVSVDLTIRTVMELKISPEEKQTLLEGLSELNKAKEEGNKPGFLSALKKVCSVAERATDVAESVLPLIAKLATLLA